LVYPDAYDVCDKRHTDIGRLWSALALCRKVGKKVDRSPFVYIISYILMERLTDE